MELKINNLSKTYSNGVHALKNVTLNIKPGMFGLLGPNGAGKSTLMRTIATLQRPDEGDIHFNNVDILKEKNEIRQILGYLPQNFGIYPELTAQQMLDHFALLKGITNKKERRETVNYILDQTNLFDIRRRKLGTFSGGMKQRFGIAQAIIGNPSLLIVDEPTAGLDPEERNRFYNILSDISENKIVILSTHIVDDVRQLCNQMAIIHQGEVLLHGDTKKAINKLSGKIWKKIITKQELSEYDENYNIILSNLFAGNVLIHVYSENHLENFDPSEADLEDVYFTTIQNKISKNMKEGVL